MIDYDTMTPERIAAYLAVGQECAPVCLPGDDCFSVLRDDDGYEVTLCTYDGNGRVYSLRRQRYQDEFELFGALSALGPWETA